MAMTSNVRQFMKWEDRCRKYFDANPEPCSMHWLSYAVGVKIRHDQLQCLAAYLLTPEEVEEIVMAAIRGGKKVWGTASCSNGGGFSAGFCGTQKELIDLALEAHGGKGNVGNTWMVEIIRERARRLA